MMCPQKSGKVCGVECSMHMPDKVGADVSKWKPDPCEGPSCPFSKNMRAAQCVLGSEMIEPFVSKKSFGGPKPIEKCSGKAQDGKKHERIISPDLKRKTPSFMKLEKEVRDIK